MSEITNYEDQKTFILLEDASAWGIQRATDVGGASLIEQVGDFYRVTVTWQEPFRDREEIKEDHNI